MRDVTKHDMDPSEGQGDVRKSMEIVKIQFNQTVELVAAEPTDSKHVLSVKESVGAQELLSANTNEDVPVNDVDSHNESKVKVDEH